MARRALKKFFTVTKDGVIYKFEAAEEAGYVVSVPLYPSCASQGDTFEEALANIEDALIECLSAARELDLPIPRELEHILKQPVKS
jgi:antitoxin HicB